MQPEATKTTLDVADQAPPDAAPVELQLRTLTLIRWLAIAGQTVTVITVHFGLGFSVPVVPVAIVIAVSVLINLISMTGWPASTRLGERAALALLAFDICQLAALLYLTGGLGNPFSFLCVAPVAVSATILTLRSITALSILSIAAITFLAFEHLPLPWTSEGFVLPERLVTGTWVALLTGIVFFAIYTGRISEEARRMQTALAATQLALAREQQLFAVGGLAAAAAHELGSPLGTIAVASREIARDLPAESPLREDISLLLSEVDRCRRILADLSDRVTVDDERSPLTSLPLHALIRAAADRYEADGVTPVVVAAPRQPGQPGADEPTIKRQPEIVHGLGNLIQNAIQFGRDHVEISAHWDLETVAITIRDDGPGFPSSVLQKIGQPYVSGRSHPHDHMGLGIFIACTLLHRSGAHIVFANQVQGGARVTVSWPRWRIEYGNKATA